jgi:hypothetical protein
MWSAGEEGPTARVLPELELARFTSSEKMLMMQLLKPLIASKTLNNTEK